MRNGDDGWTSDFPIREQVEDYAGRMRSFLINCHEGGLGFTVRAEEEDRRGTGYEFAAYSETTVRPAPTAPWAESGKRCTGAWQHATSRVRRAITECYTTG